MRPDDVGVCEEEALRAALAGRLSPSSVIVGIGNRDRGDDAFGPALIDALRGRTTAALADAGTVPENFAQQIAAGRPDTVLFADAAELGEAPGRLVVRSAEALADCGISTHAGNVSLIAEYVTAISGACCLFLLAQPAWTNRPTMAGPSVQDGLSPPLRDAVSRACRAILGALGGAG
ncbi:MAG: hydrogenase maturation protease [Phycisphaerae bacterium]|nr:hydrogenase maturation protease [Phycisphaerae bacterium]